MNEACLSRMNESYLDVIHDVYVLHRLTSMLDVIHHVYVSMSYVDSHLCISSMNDI